MSETKAQSDGELLAAFGATRDEAAFATLVERHGAMVHAVYCRVLNDHHMAEDVAQTVFMALMHKAETLA